MADNVMNNIGKPNFSTVSDVVRHQNTAASIFGYVGSKKKALKIDVKKSELNRLKTLRNTLKKRIESKSKIDLNDIQNKIEEWNNSGLSNLINKADKFEEIVNNISNQLSLEAFIQSLATDGFTDEVSAALTQLISPEGLNVNTQSELIEDVAREVFQTINKRLRSNNIGTISTRKISGKKSGIMKGLKIELIGDGTTRNVNVKLDTSLVSKNIIQKLKIACLNDSKEVYNEIKQRYKKEIIKRTLDEILTGIDKERILKAFESINYSNLNLYDDKNVIRGFLGELYWTAFWQYLGLPNDPTGAKTIKIKGGSGKVQMPIDGVLEGLGYQVKNYKIQIDTNNQDAQYVVFGRTMTLSGLLGRAQLFTEQTAYDNFVYSWKYNRIYEGDADSAARALEIYGPVFNRFENIMDVIARNAPSYLESRADKILRIDTNIETESNELVDKFVEQAISKDILYADLYIINNKIIESYKIVDAMMELLDKGTPDISIQFEEGGTRTVTGYPPNQAWFHDNDTNPGYRHDPLRFSYKIKINIFDILNRIGNFKPKIT